MRGSVSAIGMTNTNLESALAHVAAGRPVFPCDGERKRPVVQGGFKSASTDEAKIRTWFQNPSYIPGMPVGAKTMGGCWVLDIDVKHNAPGEESFSALINTFGPLPHTVQAITCSGGQHLYFRHPGPRLLVRNRQHRLGHGNETWGLNGYPEVPFALANTGEIEIPGIDVRGDGGYVILPGAVMIDGRTYTWAPGCSPEQVQIAEAPPWLLALVTTDPLAAPTAAPRGGGADSGPARRNPAGAPDIGVSFFSKVNSKAMASLAAWVPTVFPEAKPYQDGFRVTSKALGRILEEDISLVPAGIRDFGEERGKTPIDIVCEWGSAKNATDAALWLCSKMGVDAASLGWRAARAVQQDIRQAASGGANVVSIKSETKPRPPAVGRPRSEGDWRDNLIIKIKDDGTETVLSRVHNLILILTNANEFRGRIVLNEFSEQMLIDGQDTDDVGPILIKTVIEKNWISHERINTRDVDEAIRVVAKSNKIHPVREYLESLIWDGVERIDDFFPDICGARKDDYHMDASRSLFVSSVARILDPGCRVHLMTILISPQGFGKTTLWKVLFGEWCSELTSSLDDKDFYIGLRGVWCMDFAELDAFSKADTSRIKRIITSPDDSYRSVYGKNYQKHKRQCILVGGTNNPQWLSDVTGGRRFLPINVEHEIDTDVVAGIRDQLWAEAVVRFRRGDPWWTVRDAEIHQDAVYVEDSWEEIISDWIQRQFKTETTIAEVLERALKIEPGRQGRPEQTRAGSALRRLGWIPRKGTISGARVMIYRPDKSAKVQPV